MAKIQYTSKPKRLAATRTKYKVGKEKRGYYKGKGDVETVLGSGGFSGKAMSYIRGPGVPGNKGKKKAAWYEGKPVRINDTTWVSRVFNSKLG